MAIGEVLTENFTGLYNSFVNSLPENFRIIPPMILIGITIAIYSIFIWSFYRFLAKKDVVKLDLSKYNEYKHSGILKFIMSIIHIVEFLIISPIAIFFWFSILSLFLIVLAKDLEITTVLLIAAAVISAVRITAYFSEDLSKDLAKMFPFALLSAVILTPNFFDIGTTVNRFLELPFFLNYALYYLFAIFCLEAVLRLFYIPIAAINASGEKEKEEDSEEKEE